MKLKEILDLLDHLDRKKIKKLQRLIEHNYWQLSKDYRTFFLKLLQQKKTERIQLCAQAKKKEGRNFETKRKRLGQLVEEFLTMNLAVEERLETTQRLARFYQEKGLDSLFEQKMKECHKELQKASLNMDIDWHWLKFYELKATKNRISRDNGDSVLKMLQSLEGFHQSNYWRLRCDLLNLKMTINYDSNKSEQEYYLANLFQRIFQMLEDKAAVSAHYLNLKDKIQAPAFTQLDPAIAKTIIIYLMNYAINKMMTGEKAFAADYLAYIDQAIKHGFFLENGQLDYARYHNTVLTQLVNTPSDFQQIRAFMAKYDKYLVHTKSTATVQALLKAYVEITQQPDKNIQDLIEALELKDLDLDHKILLIKLEVMTHHNRDNYDEMENRLRSLERQVQKEQLPDRKKVLTQSFLTLAKQLMNHRLSAEHLEDYKSTLSLLDWIWLLSKCKK